MTSPLRLAAFALVTSLLTGCATTSTITLPDVDQQALALERRHMAQVALNSWDAERARLYAIREQLWQTATQRGECTKTGQDRGALLESVTELPVSLRDEVIGSGIRSNGLYVVAVTPGSPAARAGLHVGDRITGVGENHAAASNDLPKGWQDAADLSLDIANGDGNVDGDGTRTVSVGDRSLCDIDVVLDEGHEIDAEYTGTHIIVSQGMLQALPDDASLAFVLAHELSHFTANHARLASLFNPAGSRDQEREADLLGIRLVAHAGYDLTQVATIWDRLAQSDPNHIGLNWLANHPLRAERKLRLQAAIAKLQAEKAATKT